MEVCWRQREGREKETPWVLPQLDWVTSSQGQMPPTALKRRSYFWSKQNSSIRLVITFLIFFFSFCSLDFYLLSLQQGTFPVAFGGSECVCVGRKCPLSQGAKYQPSPGLPGAALQPATLEVMVRISSSSSLSSLSSSVLETGLQQQSWALGIFLSHPWAAWSSRMAGRIASLSLALPAAAAPVLWPGFASHLDFREQQNSALMVLLRNPCVTFVFPVTNSWDKTCKVETRAAFTFAFFLRNWQEIKRKLKHPWAGFCGKQCPVRQDVSGFGRCLFPAGNWRREPMPGNRALHNAPPNQRVYFQLSWCFMLTCAWFTYYCEAVITVMHFFLKL